MANMPITPGIIIFQKTTKDAVKRGLVFHQKNVRQVSQIDVQNKF
ncbi:Uncharacterised protein [Cedecea davisae]|uniref:Uncharacterized protein n=1 Tax=Cedecea davisae DSM 4568 TaxID=566551 RepID=S3IQX5_9ENTR|nr:hypothetical protein HMPREF0201_03644 [Cedecea davisae DSM 4568]SUX38028.1 Uncharacterised protein [Cedecea davisae]